VYLALNAIRQIRLHRLADCEKTVNNANENKLSPKRIRSAICTHQGQEENHFFEKIMGEFRLSL
jgi:uncharacterized protein YbcI